VLTYKEKQATQLDSIFAALSHPIRREIIELVAERPRTVNEITKPFSISRPAISQHIRILEDCGIIEQTKDGRIRHCSLNVKPLHLAFTWMVTYKVFLENMLDEIQNKVENEEQSDKYDRKL
jgi:DNA-binding transcriptional ArsR family regulator